LGAVTLAGFTVAGVDSIWCHVLYIFHSGAITCRMYNHDGPQQRCGPFSPVLISGAAVSSGPVLATPRH
jgi:hypothetical protein